MNTTMPSVTDRLRAILLKQEFHISNQNPLDTHILLVAAALAIPNGQTLTERDVTERLHGWLTTVGSNIHMDAVELRRYLIDYRCLNRDRAGASYARAEWPGEWKTIVAELERIDIETYADRVRSEEIERRAERKRAALEKHGSS